MTRSLRPNARLWPALGLILLLGACAPKPWDDPIEVTLLVRVEPEEFRVRTELPRGLGEHGAAQFRWIVASAVEGQEESEILDLERVGRPKALDSGRSEVIYRLSPKSFKAFQTQQIRQRAQLLAGYFYIDVAVAPDLCSMAGAQASNENVVSVLYDGASGQKITTVHIPYTAASIQPHVGFCV